MGARVLGCAPRWRELRPLGRGDERLGGAWPDHDGGPTRLLLPRRLPRRYAVHGAAVGPPADLSAATLARSRGTRKGRQADRRETQRDVIPARPRARETVARHALRERGQRHGCRHPACNSHADRDEPGARLHADPDDNARRDRLRGRCGGRRRGEGDPASRDVDPAKMGRRLAASKRRVRLRAIHQKQDHTVERREILNAPFITRVLRSYQQRAATYLYERDAAFLVAPLGAGKGAAALTAIAELIRDGERRHCLVIAPKLVATTVWPLEIASWPHLEHLKIAVLDGSPDRRPSLLATAAAREVTAIGVDLVSWLVGELADLADDHPLFDVLIIDETSRLKDPSGKRATLPVLPKAAYEER